MTRKEAFEHLKNSKVLLRTEDEQVKLQEFLFKIGYEWLSSYKKVLKLYPDVCVFFLDPTGRIMHNGYDDEGDKIYFDTHAYKELKFEDILGMDIDVEEVKWKDVFTGVMDSLGDKQIMVISKDNVMIIDL